MSQYEPSAPYDFERFIAAIIVTISPTSGVLRPGKFARFEICLDEMPIGRQFRPYIGPPLRSTDKAEFDDFAALYGQFRRTLGSAIIKPDAGLIVQQKSSGGMLPLIGTFSDHLLIRHRKFLANKIETIINNQQRTTQKAA